MAWFDLGDLGRVKVTILSPKPISDILNNEPEDEGSHDDGDDNDEGSHDDGDDNDEGSHDDGDDDEDGGGGGQWFCAPGSTGTMILWTTQGVRRGILPTVVRRIHPTPTPTPTYLPLTTTFTPDPCTIFPKSLCYIEGTLTIRSSPSCYPGTPSRATPPPTYSPGHFCPAGMTTVASVSIGDVAWCCPDGLTLEEDYLCRGTTTQWAYTSTGSLDCVERMADTGTPPMVRVAATPVVLKGVPQNDLKGVPQNDPKGMPQNDPKGVFTAVEVGIILGSILGVAFLSALAIIYVLRVRKAKVTEKAQVEKAPKVGTDEYTGKPELEGSRPCVYTTKAELDALATRAELEGILVESHGDDDIYVLKPELEGTAGLESNRGAYVRRKPELEAASKLDTSSAERLVSQLEDVSNQCVSTAEQHFTELEATAFTPKIGLVSSADRSPD
ncbi:hypothetical protein EKO27_g5044 [Xylaria grammica]|uniref:Uncharacterized protein n=1 Tax=Xylaria grammica TaxID=363999 RepID=A0A439D6R0_9PEZI|nr:hypothetical protein EKO27_g5044 [Xylaria grammica]